MTAIGLIPISAGRQALFLGLIVSAWSLCPVWFVCMQRRVGENWLCVPILFGFGIIWSLISLLDDEAVGVANLLFVFPAVAAAYALKMQKAAPYAVIGLVSISVAALMDESGVNLFTLATTMVAVCAMAVTSVVALQARQRSLMARYRRLALCDPLTGVANLRALRSHLSSELAAESTGLTLFMADLDNFKQVNDDYSHSVGDEVLRAVALALVEAAQPNNFVCRKGGDEFAIAVRLRADETDIRSFEGRLAMAIIAARTSVCAGVDPRASIGFARQEPGDTPESMIDRANEALHSAKLRARRKCRLGNAGDSLRLVTDRRIADDSDSRPSRSLRRVGRSRDNDSSDALSSRGDCAAGRELSWRLGVIGFATIPAISILSGIAGANPEMRSMPVVVVGAASLMAAPLLVWIVGHASDEMIGHGSLLLSLGLLTALLMAAPDSRLALVDYFLLPVLVAFLFLSARWSLAYAAASMFLYSWFAVHQAHGYPAAKIAVAILVLTVLGALFASAKRTSDSYLAKIAALSKTDELTGLANRRTLEAYLEDAAATLEEGQEIFVIAIDLDDFKSVNDRYSHTVGDSVLHAVALAITSVVRTEDVVARRGGDEFAVVLQRESGTGLDKVVDRIRAAIERERSAICPDITPCATIAVARLGLDEPVSGILARADHELHAERKRRNYVSSRAASNPDVATSRASG